MLSGANRCADLLGDILPAFTHTVLLSCEEPATTVSWVITNFLLQSRLRQHLQELLLRPHVDGLCDQFSLTIVDEAFRYSLYLEQLVNLSSGIEHDRIADVPFCDKRLYFVGIFIGDCQNHETLVLESLVQRVEIGHFFAAWRAPCG